MNKTDIDKQTELLLQQELTRVLDKYHKGQIRAQAIKQLKKQTKKPINNLARRHILIKWLLPSDFYLILVLKTVVFIGIGGLLFLLNIFLDEQKTCNILLFAIGIPLGDLFLGLFILLINTDEDKSKTRYMIYVIFWLILIGTILTMTYFLTTLSMGLLLLTAVITAVFIPMLMFLTMSFTSN